MKTTSFGIKAALVATMILSGQSFAQSLPDEINHPHYKNIYENLEKILNQKIAEFTKLNNRKIELEKSIAEREKLQADLPARNAELTKLIQDTRAEIAQIDSDIQGLQAILAKVEEDLRNINSIINQLQNGINEESNNNRNLTVRRNQIAQDLANFNARLQREVEEENRAVNRLSNLDSEHRASVEKREDLARERVKLGNDVNRFKTEIVQTRNAVNQNNNNLTVKKPLLADAQAKLPPVKAEISAQEAKLAQIDATLNPKKVELGKLKAELGRLSPDIARLQTENRTLEQKISANNAKIGTLNVDGQIARRNAIEAEIAGTKNQISANTNSQIALQDKIKPTLGQINTLRQQQQEAARRRDMPEVARLKAEIDRLNATIQPDQAEIKRLLAENNRLAIAIAPKQNEINQLNTAITNAQAQVTALQNENNTFKAKIAENDKKIAEQSTANAGLAKQIADLEAEINAVEATRNPIALKISQLKSQEGQIQNQINVLGKDVQELENENKRLNASIAQMEKAINDYPNDLRRIDAHTRQIDEKLRDLRVQIDNQRQLVVRIQQSRVAIQRDRDNVQRILDGANMDLAESNRLIENLRNKLNEQARSRDGLVRYSHDSQKKLDNLKLNKSEAEQDIAGASQEIKVNEEDLATIASELPKLRSDLNTVNPQVVAAENARKNAQTNVNNANDQYQSRLSLYQRYLSESQALGAEKASIGSADGVKAGSVEAKAKAQKLGSENASAEGKWEALRRGYTRGEIAGFRHGFDIGMASAPDAERGDAEGKVAGAKRAKDHANMVIKPEKYLAELERRLQDDETSSANKAKLAGLVTQELGMIKAMSMELKSTIPDLTQAEIAEAQRIVSSLDSLIAQADIEIDEILALRKNLAVARNVYVAPGAGENANNVNCSAVYKSVKDFVEACKGAYVMRYQNLYNTAHADTFNKEYGSLFNAQIERVFEAELNRLYAGYEKEALSVGREVGISTGKREIYQQNFNRAESASYAGNLPIEVARVENEAQNLVQEHLNQNAALALKAQPKLITSNIYGIAPGVDTDLKMLIKNVGSEASQANSFVRIKEISGNLQAERREAPVTSVAARSHSDLSIMKVKVSDAAVPGSKAIIVGEIVHPGNHYRSSRVENFRLESVIAVNPSITSGIEFDKNPNVQVIFVTKKHDIDVKIAPKHAGVPAGYEVVVEELGTSFVQVVSRPGITEPLARGQEKKVTFTYKLNKAAKGKVLNLKVSVKNEGKIVSQETIQIQPR